MTRLDRSSSRESTGGRSRSRGSPGSRMSLRWSTLHATAASSSPSAAAATAPRLRDRRRRDRHRPLSDGRREIDVDHGTAWAGTGTTAGKYTLATAEKGRATGLGDTGSVGIGGITLAAAIGYLARKNGLTIDNLLAAEIVTADGEVRPGERRARAGPVLGDPRRRRQLRRRHAVPAAPGRISADRRRHADPAGDAATVIGASSPAAEAAPEELSTIANVMLAPPMPFVPEEAHGKLVIMGHVPTPGRSRPASRCSRRSERSPSRSPTWCGRCPIRSSTRAPSPRSLHGRRQHVRRHDRPAAAEAMLEHLPKSTADDGRPAADARRRDGASPERRDRVRASRAGAVRERRGDVHGRRREGRPRRLGQGVAYALGRDGAGGYVGFLGEEDEATIRAAYPGATWDRLRKIKRRYDPDNLFRLNHNIPPADGSES